MGRSTTAVVAGWCATLFCAVVLAAEPSPPATVQRDKYGGIFRGDDSRPQIALIFTGDEYAEGTASILDVLGQRHIKAGFFVTGKYLRQAKLKPLIRRMVAEGHYLGPHSDRHLLYCDWDERERSLLTREQFAEDLRKNLDELRAVGALDAGGPVLFVPPYEWYNADQVRWSQELGVTLINFTPGSGSNRDYIREGDPKFLSSAAIVDGILAFEERESQGLNGFLLLLHLGSGRKDPVHARLDALIGRLTERDYDFLRVDELLGHGGRGGEAKP